MKIIGITGIDTEVGKTVISAIVVEALKADYWKMVQAGELDALDSDKVKSLISNSTSVFHPEQFLLSKPMSPHAAAKFDEIDMKPNDFKIPETENILIVEGAGGVLVPINENGDTIGTLLKNLVDEVIVVSKNYLGSINHTLLTISYLKQENIKVKGIIFNGKKNPETEQIIAQISGVNILGYVPQTENLNQNFIKEQALLLQLN